MTFAATPRSTIARFSEAEWPAKAAELIQRAIDAVLCEKPECSVMLTGGRSARRLYGAWTAMPAFQQMTGVSFFFGDERSVPADSPESNHGMAMRTLFPRGVPPGCVVIPIESTRANAEAEARRYGAKLPSVLDVLLLGIGEDGHIASLFPGSSALREHRRRVVPVVSPIPPHNRWTITPAVIESARTVFVLAPGPTKARILSRVLDRQGDTEAVPACLVAGAEWILDTSGAV